MEIFIIVVFVVACLVGIAGALYQTKKRRRMWESVATRYGFSYRRSNNNQLATQFRCFELFQRGKSWRVSNRLKGTHQGTHVVLFDYAYIGRGGEEGEYSLSALIARVDISCPYLVIRPETLVDKGGDFFGSGDIDFEFEDFNRRFHVKGPDKKFAYEICHCGMIDFLLQHEKLTWELSGNHIVLYGLGAFDPAKVAYCLKSVVEFIARIPQHSGRG